MKQSVLFQHLVPADAMAGCDESETNSLHEMLKSAEAYLTSHKWCPAIVERFFAFGVGGVIALFLFRLSEKIHGTDDLLWVVDGDVPAAYLVTDKAPDAGAALAIYVELMEEWANAVLSGSSLESVFPVDAAPTPEHANMLLSRTQYIRDRLIPLCQGESRPPT